MQKTSKILIGSVQVTFCGSRFRSNRFKHSVKRFDRFGLDTLNEEHERVKSEITFTLVSRKFCLQLGWSNRTDRTV